MWGGCPQILKYLSDFGQFLSILGFGGKSYISKVYKVFRPPVGGREILPFWRGSVKGNRTQNCYFLENFRLRRCSNTLQLRDLIGILPLGSRQNSMLELEISLQYIRVFQEYQSCFGSMGGKRYITILNVSFTGNTIWFFKNLEIEVDAKTFVCLYQ